MPTGGTVLVVEDDAEIRTFLTDLLQDDGFTVVTAEDGRTAIAMLRDRRPPPEVLCLVILDMMLPEVSGAEVLRQLVGLGSYVPVVAMSANRDQLQRASETGAQDTLAKPFSIDRLLSVVRRNCRTWPSASASDPDAP
jgi:DNA-binding response OmpR family regulator